MDSCLIKRFIVIISDGPLSQYYFTAHYIYPTNMLQHMERLDCLRDEKKLLYYTNTDSIYVHTSQVGNIMTNFLGDVKQEYGEIIEAIFISPKVYYLRLRNGEEITRMKGIDRISSSQLTRDSYLSLINGKSISLVIPFSITKHHHTSKIPFSLMHREHISITIIANNKKDGEIIFS